MHNLAKVNDDDGQQAAYSCESINHNKAARNAQWHVTTVTESFKQHGHIYLAIVNLAAHLSYHPIAKTLMNIGNTKAVLPTSKHKKSLVGKKEESERVPSVEQIHHPIQNYKERWRSLAAAAMSDGRGQVRGGTNISLSSDVGKTDSISIEVQQKIGSQANINDPSQTHIMGYKQSIVNKVAASKLFFIEQILYDLTLIKDEIEFQTDPIHYNEPGHSFA